jgi:hypothetical protein
MGAIISRAFSPQAPLRHPNPGRCPGLVYLGPSAREAWHRHPNPGRCPGLVYLGPSARKALHISCRWARKAKSLASLSRGDALGWYISGRWPVRSCISRAVGPVRRRVLLLYPRDALGWYISCFQPVRQKAFYRLGNTSYERTMMTQKLSGVDFSSGFLHT